MRKVGLIGVISFLYLVQIAVAQDTIQDFRTSKEKEDRWVDSVYNSMTNKQRIGQLMMILAHSNKDKAYHESVAGLIKQYQVGGLCFFQGGPGRQVNLTNYYQSLSKLPLLISMDAEWGLGMRLDSTYSFPRQMTLGAIQDKDLIYEMGEEIANHLKRIGVHINFAPVVDINVNPNNPVINTRSFGEDRVAVADKSKAYMDALQNNNIIAVAKHFPGHGDTETDSHHALPLVDHSWERIDSIELYPFRELIYNGLNGVMSAHLYIPSLDPTPNTAGTISPKVINGILRNQLVFDGLIFTDALEMKGVTKYNPPGELELKAFMAGNDILLLPEDVGLAIDEIDKALQQGVISDGELEVRVRRVLHYKYLLGLNNYHNIDPAHVYEDINDQRNEVITRSLAEHALTLVKNENKVLPLERLDTLKVASVAIGTMENTYFQKQLNYYSAVDHFHVSEMNPTDQQVLLKKLEEYNLVILSVHNTSSLPQRNFGLKKADLDFVNSLADRNNVVLNVFANPYSLAKFQNIDNIKAVVVAYQEGELFETAAAQAVFGGVEYQGKLPVSVGENFPVGTGIKTKVSRLAYVKPQDVNINEVYLEKIDSVVNDGIRRKAFPGCQVLAIKDGKVFLNKSYGYHTYSKKEKVKGTDLYDVASITKIAATTPMLMQLYGQGVVQIDERLSDYLPALRLTNKKNLIIRDVLAHQARLTPWIPYYLKTIDNKGPLDDMYAKEISEEYPVRVAENMFLKKDYDFMIRKEIFESDLNESKDYKYSDLGFILMYFALENLMNQPYEQLTHDSLYAPLGMNFTSYLPKEKFDKKQIIPTEKDKKFRMQLIHGDVHDQAAAMLGGVCGHAGLFSNANDLAKLMQLYLNEGHYGGKSYFPSSVMNEFTLRQFPLNENRRGLGFDKAWVEDNDRSPVCESAGMNSFGHSGFTGTLAWADPDNGLIFVFLSNRIHPSMDNKKLIRLNIRSQIHEFLYKAVE
jgi:beta-glucosidase-like glycosyl hydrolase/CubicO group peptidase (beta-lactamase class C family)